MCKYTGRIQVNQAKSRKLPKLFRLVSPVIENLLYDTSISKIAQVISESYYHMYVCIYIHIHRKHRELHVYHVIGVLSPTVSEKEGCL